MHIFGTMPVTNIYITLPPHLVAFMKQDALKESETITINSKGLFGTMVINNLEPMPEGVKPGPPKDHSYLQLRVSERFTRGRGNWLRPDNERMIVSWITRLYEREMGLWIRERRARYRVDKLAAVKAWRAMNGIDDDMRPLENDLKLIHRKRIA